jgi:HSP20 family protein
MAALVRFDPWREFVSLRDAVDRLFEESIVNTDRLFSLIGTPVRAMPLEVYETPDEMVVRAMVPGVKPDNLQVEYQDGVLTLRAKTEAGPSRDDWTWHLKEIAYGEVVRSITLPKAIDVDRAEATFADGVLTLRLPKAEHAKPKQIKVVPQAQLTAGSTT